MPLSRLPKRLDFSIKGVEVKRMERCAPLILCRILVFGIMPFLS